MLRDDDHHFYQIMPGASWSKVDVFTFAFENNKFFNKENILCYFIMIAHLLKTQRTMPFDNI